MSRPVYGRIQVAEPLSSLAGLHVHKGEPLKTVDHEPKVGVLDQSDLLGQGIYCSELIPGAQDVDALGSCVLNTNTEALSNVLPEAVFLKLTGCKSYEDTDTAERFAVVSYHGCTDQTGDPDSEWPPTDCGSSGLYAYQYDRINGWIGGQAVAHGAQNVVSLLQWDGVMVGMPFFYACEDPDDNGFIDGNGTVTAIEAMIQSGLAGGHELYISAIEKLVLLRTGQVDPFKTVLRLRNHWTAAWGDNGSGRVHLSTFEALGSHVDFRQLRK